MGSISFNIKEVPGDTWETIKKYNEMAGLSMNQMYKQSGAAEAGVSYKDWIASEENLYQKKIEDGKIQGQMPFQQWMCKRWAGKLNASGFSELVTGLKGIGKEVLNKTILNKEGADTAKGDAASPGAGTNAYIEPEKRILGMKPVVFYSVAALGAVATIFVVVKIIKNVKS
jgi:hypothetical protein